MKVRLMPRAQQDLREHSYYIATGNPEAAEREWDRVLADLERFAALPVEGVFVNIQNVPRRIHRWWMPPFRVYYERIDGELVVHRLYHHARRPIERPPR
jgi:plasmid stabilization system protein ParE